MNKSQKSKKMTIKDWDDVADLLEQAAESVEYGYENHTRAARDKTAKIIRSHVFKAHDKAREIENEMIADKMMEE